MRRRASLKLLKAKKSQMTRKNTKITPEVTAHRSFTRWSSLYPGFACMRRRASLKLLFARAFDTRRSCTLTALQQRQLQHNRSGVGRLAFRIHKTTVGKALDTRRSCTLTALQQTRLQQHRNAVAWSGCVSAFSWCWQEPWRRAAHAP
jgi:hypothetical protein